MQSAILFPIGFCLTMCLPLKDGHLIRLYCRLLKRPISTSQSYSWRQGRRSWTDDDQILSWRCVIGGHLNKVQAMDIHSKLQWTKGKSMLTYIHSPRKDCQVLCLWLSSNLSPLFHAKSIQLCTSMTIRLLTRKVAYTQHQWLSTTAWRLAFGKHQKTGTYVKQHAQEKKRIGQKRRKPCQDHCRRFQSYSRNFLFWNLCVSVLAPELPLFAHYPGTALSLIRSHVLSIGWQFSCSNRIVELSSHLYKQQSALYYLCSGLGSFC